MVRKPIADTTLAGLRPLGVAGRRVLDSWEQIDSYLRTAPQPGLADLFAEPVAQPGGRITWFAPEGKSVKRFQDLSPADQETLRAALEAKVAQVEAMAGPLLGSSNQTARLIGETLQRALSLPGDSEGIKKFLFSVDGEPVLINWGTEPEGALPAHNPLKEFIRRAAPPPPPAAPPPVTVPPAEPPAAAPAPVPILVERPFAWWSLLWLLFALLTAWIFYVLMIGCGIWPGGSLLNHCPVRPMAMAPAPAPESVRTDALRAELASLEQRLEQAPRCEPPTPAAPRRANSEFDRRMAESGAAEGELTVTLIWNTSADLDLHVGCPDGAEIYFRNTTACGGVLDVDANSASPIARPVENIHFRQAKPGSYRIEVNNFKDRGAGSSSFQVRVKKGSEETVYDGQLGTSGKVRVVDVTIP
ncbi:hypothetical protein [Roseomonas genomospecies 6]|uniref:Uncharacterized protein n=1 Tax=Roseomonas genomospecies 6 TaxID=214106 RepID=A0A9W7KN08_9PROT|nr:hypothetical protein [Roseomonas genomospecies 6]KAA0675697.1 hypothetical protein DS843_30420 [Roseomonas genomospecies 6]